MAFFGLKVAGFISLGLEFAKKLSLEKNISVALSRLAKISEKSLENRV